MYPYWSLDELQYVINQYVYLLTPLYFIQLVKKSVSSTLGQFNYNH